jgi:peroxiredoxin
MNKPIISSILLILISSLVYGQGYEIKTKIVGQEDSVAYLGHHFATQRYVDDTARVVNGVASFTGSNELVNGVYFYYSPSVYFEFLISEQNFSIEGEASDVIKTAKIKDSPLNEGFYDLQRFNFKKRTEADELKARLDSTTSETDIAEIRNRLTAIDVEIRDYQQNLQEKYAGTLLEKLILLMQTPQVPEIPEGEDSVIYRYNYYKGHFWDGIDITDPGLLRSPLLHNKIMDYLDNVVVQQVDTVIMEVDKLLQLSQANPEAFRYLLITLTNKYVTPKINGHDEVFVHLVDQYYLTGLATWTDEATVKKLEERAASIRPNFIGDPAHPFILQDTLGTDYALYDIKAKYTVLYFYDPDCGHCKKSTPLLYDAYADLQSKNVEVLAICTTTDKERWQEFIIDNDLNWTNLADLTGVTHIKFYYDVRSTPTVYILDEEKKILLKKIPSENIPEIIDQLISNTDEG